MPKQVVKTVSGNWRTATGRLSYNGTKLGSLPRFKLSRARFSGVRGPGTLAVWPLRDQSASRSKASATLSVPAACDGRGDAITLERKP